MIPPTECVFPLESRERGFIDIARGVVDAHEKDLPNLMKRSAQSGHAADGTRQPIGYWPSADYLRKLRVNAITDQDRNYRGEGLHVSSHGWIYQQTGNGLQFHSF